MHILLNCSQMNIMDLTDEKSTLVQVMVWCHEATSHYLSQCWPRSISPYDVTRPQWVQLFSASIVYLKHRHLGLYLLNGKTLYIRFCKMPKLWNMGLELSDCCDIWKVPQQQCCWGTFQISQPYNKCKTQSGSFKNSQNLLGRHLVA